LYLRENEKKTDRCDQDSEKKPVLFLPRRTGGERRAPFNHQHPRDVGGGVGCERGGRSAMASLHRERRGTANLSNREEEGERKSFMPRSMEREKKSDARKSKRRARDPIVTDKGKHEGKIVAANIQKRKSVEAFDQVPQVEDYSRKRKKKDSLL